MRGTAVTLGAVEEFIGAKHKGLQFPDWLERRFDADTRPRRAQRLRAAILPNVIVYNLFLIPDWFLIPDRFALAVLLHAFVVTPWIIFAGWLASERHSRFVREAATASVPVAIVLQILCTFSLSYSSETDHYQYFVLLVILFTNTIQRLPYAYAATVSGLIVLLHGAAVAINVHMSGPALLISIMTLFAAAYLTLISNYYLERDARRSYLHGLRDRLRHAEADAAAKRDALTELGNRNLLAARVEELWGVAGERDADVGVILLDIDHFKLFNDRYGHGAGDLCLKRVAACVSAELRGEEDTAIRYGGEEILALLPGADMRTAIRVAERIRRTVEAFAIPHEGLGPWKVVTASLGVAVGPVARISSTELIAAADAALYAAKRNGRNQVWPPLLKGSEGRDEGGQAAIVAIARK